MHRIFHKLVHERGYGWVQDEGDKEEEPEHADDAEGAQEQGGVVLDVVQPGLGLLGVPHGGVSLGHDGACQGTRGGGASTTGGSPSWGRLSHR